MRRIFKTTPKISCFLFFLLYRYFQIPLSSLVWIYILPILYLKDIPIFNTHRNVCCFFFGVYTLLKLFIMQYNAFCYCIIWIRFWNIFHTVLRVRNNTLDSNKYMLLTNIFYREIFIHIPKGFDTRWLNAVDALSLLSSAVLRGSP